MTRKNEGGRLSPDLSAADTETGKSRQGQRPSGSAPPLPPTPRSPSVEIVEEYYDEAVSGADTIDTRPGFKAMLERLLSNGVRTIVVETANRFARD